jgi:hypothetical protein
MTRTREADTSRNISGWPATWLDTQRTPAATTTTTPAVAEDRLGGPRGWVAPTSGTTPQGDPALQQSVRTTLQAINQSPTRAGAPKPVHVDGKAYHPGDGDKLWLDLESKGRSYAAWAKKNPAAATTVGPPWRTDRMIRKLEGTFHREGSPLARFAPNFVVAGYLSGYDPRFIGAFAAEESAWGRAVPGNAPYNYWGWSVDTGQQSSGVAKPFASPGTAFRYFGEQLHQHYGGARSVYSPIWGPYAADPNHERNIASIMSTYFHGDPNNIRFWDAMRGRT